MTVENEQKIYGSCNDSFSIRGFGIYLNKIVIIVEHDLSK